MLLLVVEMEFDFVLMFDEISAVSFEFHDVFLIFWVKSPNGLCVWLNHNRRLRRNDAVILLTCGNNVIDIKIHSLNCFFTKLEFLIIVFFNLLFVFYHVLEFHSHQNFNWSSYIFDQNQDCHILITHDLFIFLLHVHRPININRFTIFPNFH